MLDSHFRKEEFKKSVKENVKMLYRKTLDEASQEQIFQAVSLAVKDVVIDNWLLTQKQYEKDDCRDSLSCAGTFIIWLRNKCSKFRYM